MPELSSIQRQMVWGSLLGDSYMCRVKSGAWFRMSHGSKQIRYLLYKAQVLKDISGSPIETYKKGSSVFHQMRWHTKREFGEMFDRLYGHGSKLVTPSIVKDLTDVELSYWFCDDGTVNHDDRAGFNASDRAVLYISSKSVIDPDEIAKLLHRRFDGVSLRTQENKKASPIYKFSFDVEATQRLALITNIIALDVLPKKVIRPRRTIRGIRRSMTYPGTS